MRNRDGGLTAAFPKLLQFRAVTPASPRSPVWSVVAIAALAMVATLPGRSQGLGLITEPLLTDLHLDRVRFAEINLWSSLAGSVFAIGFGRLFDRWGARTLALTLALLGLSVLALSRATGLPSLILGLWLSRALGQSALSAGSISLVGLVARNRPPSIMAAYSIQLSIGFMIAFPAVGFWIRTAGWRTAWAGVGAALIAFAVGCSLVLSRSSDLRADTSGPEAAPELDFTLAEALATPAFWIFGLSSSVYGLVASGIGLFNESILAELGFPPELYLRSLAVTALTGLIGNFIGGWLLDRVPPRILMLPAMALLALGLATLPHLHSVAAVYGQAAVMGVAGGLVTVLFFSYWPRTFGKTHLGSIQGSAQFLTVVASAAGPLVLAQVQLASGSYSVAFRLLAILTALLGVAAWMARTPSKPRFNSRPLSKGLAHP